MLLINATDIQREKALDLLPLIYIVEHWRMKNYTFCSDNNNILEFETLNDIFCNILRKEIGDFCSGKCYHILMKCNFSLKKIAIFHLINKKLKLIW